MSQILISHLIQQLNNVQEGGLWVYANFKNKLDTLSDDEALLRPVAQLHSVAEIISHILVWRNECMLRLKGLKTELMDSPDNWRSNEELKATGWSKVKKDFYESQHILIDMIKGQDDRYLNNQYLDTSHNFQYLIEGIIHHDIYHLGQIGLVIKMLKENKSNSF